MNKEKRIISFLSKVRVFISKPYLIFLLVLTFVIGSTLITFAFIHSQDTTTKVSDPSEVIGISKNNPVSDKQPEVSTPTEQENTNQSVSAEQVVQNSAQPTSTPETKEQPKITGYTPREFSPEYVVHVSNQQAIVSAGGRSETITVSLNKGVANWGVGSFHSYLAVDQATLNQYGVVLVIHHSPSDMIRSSISFHFEASPQATGTHGAVIHALIGNDGTRILKDVYVTVQ